MKKIERIEREKRFSAARLKLVKRFERAGFGDKAQDLAQSSAVILVEQEKSKGEPFSDSQLDFLVSAYSAYARESIKGDKERFTGLEEAADKRDPNTPHEFLAAREIASAAIDEGLVDIAMGHSLSTLAEAIGCTKQNVHRMLNRGRENLSHFLAD